MEIVAYPGIGGTNCNVAAPPPVDQKDNDKTKLSEENSEKLIENNTKSCVESHKVIDDHNNNMESWIVVVGDISCVLPINKVSRIDEVGVDHATETNIELKGSVENLELDEHGEGMEDYEQMETDDQGKEVLVNEYPSRVIFPATFVCPEIEIEFGSLGKSTLIFPPEYVSPKLNIKFGSFGEDDDTDIGLENPNQETEPLCGANKEDEKVTCETIEDDMASDHAQTENAAVEFNDERISDTYTVVEDSSQVIETKCAVISNNNPEMIVTNLLEDEKVATCGTLEDVKASDAETEDAAAGFEDERVSDTDTMVEDSSWVIEPKCDATSNNNPDVTPANLQQHDGQGVGDVIQWVGDLVVINYNALKVVPSFEIERLNEQIKKARIQLDEKTRLRDAISDKVQKMKESLRARKNEGVNVSNLKISAAKKMVKSKRHEIDYVQRVIKNLKRAISAGEVGNKIFEVKHSTDEKSFVHIIKQLNDIRDQVSSYMVSYDEVQQALHLEDRIQEVLKNLNKELKTLKDDVSKAELVAKATSKSYKEDFAMEKVLTDQFIAAEAIHQQAFWHLNSLKNRLDDEVEELMYGLKTNEELGTFVSIKQDTLDGPLNQEVAGKSVPVQDEIKTVSVVPMENTQRRISFVEENHSDDQTKEEVAEEIKQMMKTKEPANSAVMMENQEMENFDESRKADELNKQETATKLKEQSQLDKFMKVGVTMETNKRNAEKAQAPAEQRAQKEADQRAQKEALRKEKARLKRLRKKKNKRPCHDANGSSIHDIDLAESNEVDNTDEEPRHAHFVSKQAKLKIYLATKFRNIKNWLQHSGKMAIAAAPILSLLSLSVEEKHSDAQIKEEVAEENKQMMKTKEPANSSEMIDNQEMENVDESRKSDELKKEETETKLKEQTQLDEIMKVEKTMEMNEQNVEKAQASAEHRDQKEAEKRAQKEAMRKEKARLKRLRKKKNKRPCHDANGSNIHDVDLAESNEVDNTDEEPRHAHFVSKQAKLKIYMATKFRNIKNWLQHSGKMAIVAAPILSLLSLLTCYTYTSSAILKSLSSWKNTSKD